MLKWYAIYSSKRTGAVINYCWIASFRALNARCAMRMAQQVIPKQPMVARLYQEGALCTMRKHVNVKDQHETCH